MSPHITYDRKPVPSLCPKCGTAKLHRSRSTSRTEELRKKYSVKRPFRCQECGWRGWIDEAHLRYPLKVPGMGKLKVSGKDVDVPDFDLDARGTPPAGTRRADASFPPAADPGNTTETAGNAERGASSRTANALQAGAPARAGSAVGTAPREEGAAVAGAASRDPESDDASFISTITGESTKPFTRKVADDFHRHAHHKASACPACGKYGLYRSHTRTATERLRKLFTSKRPYRCHSCSWRGWVQKGF